MVTRWMIAVLGNVLLLSVSLPLHAREFSTAKLAGREGHISRSQAVFLSALFPGLGQLATGHRYRGTALVAAEMACLVVFLTSHEDYKTQLVQFNHEKEYYLSFRDGGSFQEAEESWKRLTDKQDDMDGSHLRRRLFGVLAAAVYGYNLLDVLWFGGSVPLSESSLSLVPAPNGPVPGVALVVRF